MLDKVSPNLVDEPEVEYLCQRIELLKVKIKNRRIKFSLLINGTVSKIKIYFNSKISSTAFILMKDYSIVVVLAMKVYLKSSGSNLSAFYRKYNDNVF